MNRDLYLSGLRKMYEDQEEASLAGMEYSEFLATRYLAREYCKGNPDPWAAIYEFPWWLKQQPLGKEMIERLFPEE